MQSEDIKLDKACGSNENDAAGLLKRLFLTGTSPEERGTGSILCAVFMTGQVREQIDLLLHISFPDGLRRQIQAPSSLKSRTIFFQDLLVVLEVKDHPRQSVRFSAVNADVWYKDAGWKSASTQSHEQVHSAWRFLKNRLGWRPWVCNLIFFTNLLESDLPQGPHNYLASDSSLQNLLERLQSPHKNRSFRSWRRAMFFSCVSASNAAQREERNRQLADLLRVKEIAETPPTPLPPPYTPPQILPSPLQPHALPQRQRISRGALFLGAALVLLMAVGMIRAFIGGRSSAPTNMAASTASNLPQPTLRTCMAVTSRCGCAASSRFPLGKTIFFQFVGRQQSPAEESIHDPQGRTLPLSFHANSVARHSDGSCFIARFSPDRNAVPGSYFVQATSQANDHIPPVFSPGDSRSPRARAARCR
jgi:hypothetical protein